MSTPAHWLGKNETTRLPRCWIALDTEATREETPTGETQSFALAVAAAECSIRNPRRTGPRVTEVFHDPADLWRWVTARCHAGRRTVLVAHNLAYDLRIGQAFTWLPRLGWQLRAIRLDGGQTWATWRRDGASLVMVDTTSWLPTTLEKIGRAVGIAKPPLPAPGSPLADLEHRCRADVDILATAWARILAWLEADDLGSFKPTGAGQSWAAFRHRFLTHRILVHDDDRAREAEREAAHAGRCEAWRWGDLGAGPWVEWDWAAAYARIAREAQVPTVLAGHHAHLPSEARRRLQERRRVLARCRVTTEAPTAPLTAAGGLSWPVGTFDTVLWDVEMDLVERHGGTVEVLEAWSYRRAPALAAWATWVLGWLEAEPGAVDEVARLVVKGWSRALIGRFGSRWSSWEPFGTAHTFDVSLGRVGGPAADGGTRLLQLGRQLLIDTDVTDSPDACPQVMSWVMAACRVRLWETMEAAGMEHVAYVDTDSVLVDQAGHQALQLAQLDGLRVKGAWRRVKVYGPRQLVLQGQLRAAGIPRNATPTGPNTWEGDVWRRLGTSLARSEPDVVTIARRRVTLKGRDKRRQHLPGGRTDAIRV